METKNTWPSCQGYTYDADPGDNASVVFAGKRAQTTEPREVTLLSKVAADISCDTHLLSGVTLRSFF